MAIIVPTSILTWGVGPVWTLTEKDDNVIMNKMKEKAKGNQWSLRFLMAAEAVMEGNVDEKCISPGISTPKPIGIITYEDIIDMILQKTSLDEKDFYDRNTFSPPTKTRKAGDFSVDMTALVEAHASSGCKPPQASVRSKGSLRIVKNTLRRRKVTNEKTVCAADNSEKAVKPRPAAPGAMDGAYENSSETRSDDLNVKKTRGECIESSYTANSEGGFHADSSSHSVDNGNMLTAEDVAELATAASWAHPKASYESSTMRSLPPRRRDSRSLSDELKQKFRRVSAAPKLPTFRRVTPFSRDTVTSLGKEGGTDLIMPEPSTTGEQDGYERMFHPSASGLDIDESMEAYFERSANDPVQRKEKNHVPEKSGDTMSLQSNDDGQDREDDLTYLYDAFPVSFTRSSPELSQHHSLVPIAEETEKKYDGFPMELLNENKENRAPKYVSSTMPRIMGTEDFENFEGTRKNSPPGREKSFHDDRSLLPSQRRAIQQDDNSVPGIRRTSLWF
jgi:metal transporter CNNM